MTNLTLLQQKARTSILLASLLLPFSASAQKPFSANAKKTIGITQIVDHPSLNAIREGIITELADQGFKEGENLTILFESAQGNPTTAVQIAQKYASLSLDAVIPISTPSAQAVVHQIKTAPIIFAAITNPVEAKIVSSLEHPGGNVTGVSDMPPLLEQLNMIINCIPHLKVLGVVYNPGEANSVAMLESLTQIAREKNIEIKPSAAPKSADVPTAARNIVSSVDAIFVGNDNTVVSGLEGLVTACLQSKKPLFVSDPDSVKRGALAAYAYDQRQMGRQVGKMVARVLRGENPGNIPVEKATTLDFSLNPHTAEKLKITCEMAH